MSISEDRAVAYVRLCSDHVDTVLAMEQESYPDPWTQGMFCQEIVGSASSFYVVLRDGEIVGYGGFWLLLDEAHITKITVRPDLRGQGHGQELLDFLMGRAREQGAVSMRLEVRYSNHAAQGLYRANGFYEVGIRKGYYARSGEDAIVMVKSLE
jgi:ribosomal-protein-alanine N-acetyltransferase